MSPKVLMNAVALLAGLLLVSSGNQGCSVWMAARQPAKKDLSVLEKGTPRSVVRKELGAPVDYDEAEETHGCHETFVFKQGYSGPTKAARATFHLAADVFTLGLWEILGTPTELYFDGTDVRLEVLYDDGERVESVCVYSGDKAVKFAPLVSPADMSDRTKSPAATTAPTPTPIESPESEEGGGGTR